MTHLIKVNEINLSRFEKKAISFVAIDTCFFLINFAFFFSSVWHILWYFTNLLVLIKFHLDFLIKK